MRGVRGRGPARPARPAIAMVVLVAAAVLTLGRAMPVLADPTLTAPDASSPGTPLPAPTTASTLPRLLAEPAPLPAGPAAPLLAVPSVAATSADASSVPATSLPAAPLPAASTAPVPSALADAALSAAVANAASTPSAAPLDARILNTPETSGLVQVLDDLSTQQRSLDLRVRGLESSLGVTGSGATTSSARADQMRAQEQDLTNQLEQARTELAALQAAPPPAPTTAQVPAGPVVAPTKTLLGSSAPAPALPRNPIAVVSCTSTLLMPSPCRSAAEAAIVHDASPATSTPSAATAPTSSPTSSATSSPTRVANQLTQVQQRVHDLQQQLAAAHLRAATGGALSAMPMSATANAAAQANLADARQQLADVTQRLNAVAATASLAARGSAGVPPSKFALTDVPADYLALYQRAAATCPGLSWTVLAGIGSIESNHGRSTLPGVTSGTNSAGAMGPMQFLAGSWAAYGVDGDGNGIANVYQPADAIFGAANYLCHDNGGDPAHLRDAIFSYNRADWYVNRVLDMAIRYGSSGLDSVAASTTPAQVVANPNIALTPDARGDLLSGKIDPRVANLLAAAASTHKLTVSVIKTGHSMYVNGTNRISNHYVGRAVDISAVDGVNVTASNTAALDLSLAILTSTSSIRPDEFGSPWLQLSGFPGAFTDDDHQDHLHVGWDS